MNWDRIEGNWKQFKGKVKEQWGKLTDDQLDVIAGKREHAAAGDENRPGQGPGARSQRGCRTDARRQGREGRESGRGRSTQKGLMGSTSLFFQGGIS